MRDVVTNTSPLLYLHQLRLLELLPQLYQRVVVPTAVVAELAEGSKHGYDVPAPSTFGWVDVEAAPGAANSAARHGSRRWRAGGDRAGGVAEERSPAAR